MAAINPRYSRLLQNEIVLTSFLWILFLIQFAFTEHHPYLTIADILFTTNYILASLITNQFLVPKFFYAARYWEFLFAFLITIFCSMLIEELVLEIWFYAGDRANIFNPIHGMIEIGAILAIFLGFKFGFDAWKKQIVINQLEKEKSASQLDHLRSQISPHFLFNNLNNLYSKALEQDAETPKLIHQLANIMRYMLYESDDYYVSLSKELTHLKDYISLQKVQLEERGIVDFYMVNDEKKNLRIAPLLLIGFVENCFKHGFSELSENLTITIHLKIEGNKLRLICSNPYSDNREKVNESLPKGIGLKNVKDRLSLLYEDQYALQINKSERVFTVELNLTLKE